ncbi:MAG: hypothetical protein ACI9TH_002527 [Kiritimatiellia bacterium]|jgi:hypothetical protein
MNATTFHTRKHLGEEDLGPVETVCGFCAFSDRRVVTRLQSGPDVDLLHCPSCGVCTASRLPTVAALENYYRGYYERSGNGTPENSQVTFKNVSRFAGHLAAVLQPELTPGPLNILDFGGGDGTIVMHMAEKLVAAGHPSVAITVVEYHNEVVTSSHPAITMRHEPNLEAVEAQAACYEVVIASAIIEHLPTAKAETERLLQLLGPGGILYVRTPFVVPVLKLMKRFGLTLDFTFPGHIHDMGQGFWETYFGKLSSSGPHRIVRSQPSIVETSLSEHFVRTVVAHLIKLPWRLLGRRYALVGGWEIFIQKKR